MTFVKHWGVWVDSEEPVTGVLSNNQINWEWMGEESVCLTCEEIFKDIASSEIPADERDEAYEDVVCDGDHLKLWGDWEYRDRCYQHKPDGEWAAVGRETTLQVVWSKTTTRGALCSPCYPGQVDLGSEGEFLAYTLPKELLVGGDEQDYADTVNKPIFPEEV